MNPKTLVGHQRGLALATTEDINLAIDTLRARRARATVAQAKHPTTALAIINRARSVIAS